MKTLTILLTYITTMICGSTMQLVNASTDSDFKIYADDIKLEKSLEFGHNLLLQTRNNDIQFTLKSNKDSFNYGFNINPSLNSNDVVVVFTGIATKKSQNFQVVQTLMQQDARSKGSIGMKIFHASPKHNNIDIYADGTLIEENMKYGEHSGYLQIPKNTRLISVHKYRDNIAFKSYDLPEKEFGGKTGILVISNSDESIDAALTLSSGDTYKLGAHNGPVVEMNSLYPSQDLPNVEVRETAQVQIIHNSPSPAVDIYVDGNLAVENFTYRSSTGLVDLPLSTVVGIAPTGGEIIAEFPFTLEQGVDYVVVASGILNNAETPFTLLASTLNEEAMDETSFALKVLHGVTDAPAVDIYADGNLLIDSLTYSDFTEYLQLPVGDYTIDITAHGAQQAVASFSAPLTGLGGGAGVLYASGFLAGADTDPAFALVLTTPSSYVVELPAAETSLDLDNSIKFELNEFTLLSNYPNPFNPVTSIRYNLKRNSDVTITIYDLLGNVVNEIFQGTQNAGVKNIAWKATNSSGDKVSSGIYIYKVETNNTYGFGRMMYLK